MEQNNYKGWLYLLPAVAFLGVFMVYPLVDVFVYSFEEGYNSASQTFFGTGLYNYAYVLRESNLRRYSDDGEPHGTAGVPTLEVLLKSDVTDVVVVVTRYFGGILLGAGGLVRAYTKGAKIALEAGGIITMERCAVAHLCCDYGQYGKIAGLIPAHGGVIDDTVFHTGVEIRFHLAETAVSAFEKQLADATNGSVTVTVTDNQFFQKK